MFFGVSPQIHENCTKFPVHFLLFSQLPCKYCPSFLRPWSDFAIGRCFSHKRDVCFGCRRRVVASSRTWPKASAAQWRISTACAGNRALCSSFWWLVGLFCLNEHASKTIPILSRLFLPGDSGRGSRLFVFGSRSISTTFANEHLVSQVH